VTEFTKDSFLGGGIKIWQPKKGYRAGIDPILLAASVNISEGQNVLDLGCGVGTASFAIGYRVKNVELYGVEIQKVHAELADLNSKENGIDLKLECSDILDLSSNITSKSFDHVIANPPYFDRKFSVRGINLSKEKSLADTCPIAEWLKVAAKRVKPKGFVHFIVRTDRLPEIFRNMPNSLGSLVITPVISRKNENAKLTILHAKKNGRGGFIISPPIILHPLNSEPSKKYNLKVDKVLRNGASLINWI
jgi:tRNA1(Val) A37 N6-methylase TrmN6